jgi:small subunit ribosomal protein S20
MAHSVSARKRVRQNATSNARNRWRLRTMREAIKEFEEKILHGSSDEAFAKCQKVIDRSAQKGVIHKNQASRRMSRLNARLVAKASGVSHAKPAKAPKAK